MNFLELNAFVGTPWADMEMCQTRIVVFIVAGTTIKSVVGRGEIASTLPVLKVSLINFEYSKNPSIEKLCLFILRIFKKLKIIKFKCNVKQYKYSNLIKSYTLDLN